MVSLPKHTTNLPNNITRLEDAIQAFKATGARLRLPYYLSLLARAYHQAGEHEKALTVIEQAMSEALNNQERCWDAELHRLRGEFFLFQECDAAEGCIYTLVRNRQSTRCMAFELRTAVSLARLWIAQKRMKGNIFSPQSLAG